MADISIKRAAIINFVARYSNIFVQLLINSILARLLTPDDFGVVAIINVFISFFTIIADMGVGPAIIQNKDLNRRNISDIFIFTVFTAVLISVGFGIFSWPLSIFYNNQVYIKLGAILSIGIFFNVLNIVPNALLLKSKQFKSLGIRTVFITILCGIVTVVLALNGAKYYALVINSVLMGILTFGFNFYYCGIKVFFSFSMASVKKIREFSSYQFGFNFINYFSRNLDNLLIGKVLGDVQLAYYDKSYKLMLYPVQNLTNVITPVLHPILSEHQEERDYVYEKYISILKILSLLGVFFGVFCFFASKEIILIMFGIRWERSIASFTILSLSIWPQVLTSSTGAIFQSLGATKQLFKCGMITTTINVILIVIGLFLGTIENVAIGIVIAYSLSFIIAYYILIKKVFKKSFWKFIKNFYTHLIILVIMSAGLMFFGGTISNKYISVMYKFLIAILGYGIGLIVTKEIKSFKSLLKRNS